MATLIELERLGTLSKLEALEPGEREFRWIYASPVFQTWLTGTLPTMASSWDIELSPLQQFVDLSEVFAGGERLSFGSQFKPLTHITDGVWELKTPDIRIFGWFPQKDYFIGAVADDATKIKTHDLYRGYANVTTRRFRESLDLDEPKFIAGEDPHAVVSNFDYS